MSENFVQKAVDILGSQSALAEACGVKQPHIHKWLKSKKIPADRAIQIEIATNGAVTKEQIRPDVDWHLVGYKQLPHA